MTVVENRYLHMNLDLYSNSHSADVCMMGTSSVDSRVQLYTKFTMPYSGSSYANPTFSSSILGGILIV